MRIVALVITDADYEFLLAPYMDIEIKDALFSTHPDKSPRPNKKNADVFNALFSSLSQKNKQLLGVIYFLT